MNTLALAEKKVKLRKVSGTHGGEWQGPCPSCDGIDRFHVWPEQQEGKGSYWCRGCGKSGDNIQFLIDFEGLSFREACKFLKVNLPDRDASWRPTLPIHSKPDFQPTEHALPADLWQEKAEKFITWAQGNLEKNGEVLAQLSDRGISAKTASDFRLGWNLGEDGKDIYRARSSWGLSEVRKENGRLKALWIPVGLVIPQIIDGIIHRIRIRRPEGEPRYYVVPGSSMSTMMVGRDRRAFVVVESELDAIAVYANNQLAGAVGLGSVSAKPDAEACEVLKRALQILVSIDYDEAGAKATAWWKEQFTRCERWPVPQGKDPGEAYRMGTDLGRWIRAGLPPALTIEERPASAQKREPTPALVLKPDTPPLLAELLELLRKNPAVRIINKQNRLAVLRDGKYVGGRINHLVFQEPQVMEYILAHPAEEIDWSNFIER